MESKPERDSRSCGTTGRGNSFWIDVPFLCFGAEKLDSPGAVLERRRCDRLGRETIGNGGNRNAGRQTFFEQFGVDALLATYEPAAVNRNQERRGLLRFGSPEVKQVP